MMKTEYLAKKSRFKKKKNPEGKYIKKKKKGENQDLSGCIVI